MGSLRQINTNQRQRKEELDKVLADRTKASIFETYGVDLSDINKVDKDENTSLYRAVIAEDLPAVGVLLELGADLGNKTFSAAAGIGSVDILEMLVSYLEDALLPDVPDMCTWELESASLIGLRPYPKVIKFLLDKGANPLSSRYVHLGKTAFPLQKAKWSLEECLEDFGDRQLDSTQQDYLDELRECVSILEKAEERCFKEIADHLVETGFNLRRGRKGANKVIFSKDCSIYSPEQWKQVKTLVKQRRKRGEDIALRMIESDSLKVPWVRDLTFY